MTGFDMVSAPFYAPQIAAAAGRLERVAADLRQRAGQLGAAVAGCEWDGAGARAFRHRAHDTTVRMRRAAADLDTAAAALRRHAGRVADEVAGELSQQAAARERALHQLRDRIGELGALVGLDRPSR